MRLLSLGFSARDLLFVSSDEAVRFIDAGDAHAFLDAVRHARLELVDIDIGGVVERGEMCIRDRAGILVK